MCGEKLSGSGDGGRQSSGCQCWFGASDRRKLENGQSLWQTVSGKDLGRDDAGDCFGIEKYLGSGLIKGVGPKYAKRIVQKFGTETIAVIETDVFRLREVEESEKSVSKDCRELGKAKEIKNVMLFLQDHGVSTSFAAKIYKQYGNESVNKVRENPFRLADDIWGSALKQRMGLHRSWDLEKKLLCVFEAVLCIH